MLTRHSRALRAYCGTIAELERRHTDNRRCMLCLRDTLDAWREHGHGPGPVMYHVTSRHVEVPATAKKIRYELCAHCVDTASGLQGVGDDFFHALARTLDSLVQESSTWNAETGSFVMTHPSFTCAVCLEHTDVTHPNGGRQSFILLAPCAHRFCARDDCFGATVTQGLASQCPLCRTVIKSWLSFTSMSKE